MLATAKRSLDRSGALLGDDLAVAAPGSSSRERLHWDRQFTRTPVASVRHGAGTPDADASAASRAAVSFQSVRLCPGAGREPGYPAAGGRANLLARVDA